MLRAIGCLDLMALLAVVAPRPVIAMLHQQAGLGPLPEGPIVGYLARTASAMYALHGVLALVVSFDLERYRPLVRWMSSIAILHGAIVLMVDLREGMPFWWTLLEGPSFALTGCAVLALLDRAERGPGSRSGPAAPS